jgi:omega-6 fatty acid desaturase / acyl-lipid omega-6 desaturase (Delta-12 desaturase)
MFSDNQRGQVILSDIGIALWLGAICYSISQFGFFEVFRLYLVPYLWFVHFSISSSLSYRFVRRVNHWLVLITILQHTDPLIPHYRQSEFNFTRGALSTHDRKLLGECGRIGAWIGATACHGIAETHVAHHIHSKIPHYHAWDAADAVRTRLAQAGIHLEGRSTGWAELYRVYRACKVPACHFSI